MISEGLIKLSYWDVVPSFTLRLETNDKEKILVFLYPLFSESLNFNVLNLEYKLKNEHSLKAEIIGNSIKLVDLTTKDFSEYPIWIFDFNKETIDDYDGNLVIPFHGEDPFEPTDSITIGHIFVENKKIDVLCFINNLDECTLQHIETFNEIDDEKLENYLAYLRKIKSNNIYILGINYELFFVNGKIFIKSKS
ncbi:hypothetical protein [Bacillus sp. EAC]|uniref:hypothetical protein n=1 Tax=Bacillus sp. EAC TaxID=1978338 RepID=UPI000B42D8C2|nr:hypothetical protein [Bacillus sp. EAC]